MGDIDDLLWVSYKEEDGHHRDGFRQFVMKLACGWFLLHVGLCHKHNNTTMFESKVHDWATLVIPCTDELEKAQTCPNVPMCDQG